MPLPRCLARSLHRRSIYQSHVMAISSLNRPSPPPLQREEQRELEELIRGAQSRLSSPPTNQEAGLTLHPDARKPVQSDFDGDINPVTGEQGGPKTEPVGQWREGEGDWSFKGRVSDF